MEAIGILKAKYDTQKVSDRYQKREFILTTEGNTPYPQHVSFQLAQEKCGVLDAYNEGDELKVQFNLRGREWNGPQGIKYFNTLEAWRVEKSGTASSTPATGAAQTNTPAANNSAPATSTANNTASAPVFTSSEGDNDDLPF